MKKLVPFIILGFTALSVTACKHPGKEPEVVANAPATTDDIVKDIYTDNFGDKIEVSINHTMNTATIHLNGKTYELIKSEDLPDYTASNSEYQFSNIKGNITFLKRSVDMVLFHHKADKKESGATKMASY